MLCLSRLEPGWKPSDPYSLLASSALCTSFCLAKHAAILSWSSQTFLGTHSACDALLGTQERVSVSPCEPALWELGPALFRGEAWWDCWHSHFRRLFLYAKLPCLINDRLNFHQVPWWNLQDVQEGASFQPRTEIPYRYVLALTDSGT